MDEHARKSSSAAGGNTAVPDWMAKRRARQGDQAAETGQDVPPSAPRKLPPIPPPPPSQRKAEVVREAQPTVENSSPFPVALTPELSLDAKPRTAEPVIAPQSVRLNSKSAKPKINDIKPEKVAPANWFEALKEQWLSKDALRGYAVSFGYHLALALILSLFVFHKEVSSMGVGTSLIGGGGEAGGGGGDGGLDDSNVLEINSPPAIQGADKLDTMLSSSNAVSDALGTPALSASSGLTEIGIGPGTGGGEGSGDGKGNGSGLGDGLGVGGYGMPAAGKFVRKGSFTAWTVPQDPEPGEDYKIIIQVQYKDPKQKLTVRDISGSVLGTDLFKLMISRHTAEFLTDANQVVVHIPGAAARVRDTIKIYSSILKENQRLDIEF